MSLQVNSRLPAGQLSILSNYAYVDLPTDTGTFKPSDAPTLDDELEW